MAKKTVVVPPPDIEAKTVLQANYLRNIRTKQLTFAIGPAGTGKTFLATMHAAQLLDQDRIEKLVFTRPMVEAGERLGFLPGDPSEKFAPYFAPVREVLVKYFGEQRFRTLQGEHRIEIAPIAYIRGHTFSECFVFLDEAQNMTERQMKMFLTRIGETGQAVVSGDPDQIDDIRGPSGLMDAVNRFGMLDEVGVTEFTVEDVVRSGLVKKIIQGYK